MSLLSLCRCAKPVVHDISHNAMRIIAEPARRVMQRAARRCCITHGTYTAAIAFPPIASQSVYPSHSPFV